MSTTSPNFSLILASSSDIVAVDSHVANNFSTVDRILSIVHTGTGQLRSSVRITTPILVSPVLSGTLSGGNMVSASTGSFNTITATGGNVTVNTFNIGTYSFPAAVGSTSTILTIVTGNAQWAASAPNTGANQALSNLSAVALNTSLGTGSGGLFTLDRIIATSGALTGLTSFQATTGTFAGNLLVTGTLTTAVLNCTGGAGTFGSVTIGTYALPSTIGANGQSLRVLSGTCAFANATSTAVFCMIGGAGSSTGASSILVGSYTTIYDPGSGISTNATYTVPSSGLYNFVAGGFLASAANATQGVSAVLIIGTTSYAMPGGTSTSQQLIQTFNIIQTVSASATVTIQATGVNAATFRLSNVFLQGYKMFDF